MVEVIITIIIGFAALLFIFGILLAVVTKFFSWQAWKLYDKMESEWGEQRFHERQDELAERRKNRAG